MTVEVRRRRHHHHRANETGLDGNNANAYNHFSYFVESSTVVRTRTTRSRLSGRGVAEAAAAAAAVVVITW